jgi:hypothetical protein
MDICPADLTQRIHKRIHKKKTLKLFESNHTDICVPLALTFKEYARNLV